MLTPGFLVRKGAGASSVSGLQEDVPASLWFPVNHFRPINIVYRDWWLSTAIFMNDERGLVWEVRFRRNDDFAFGTYQKRLLHFVHVACCPFVL